MLNDFYNTQHSPLGAFASFTVGFPGAKGGLGIEQEGPADEPLFIGCSARGDRNRLIGLPFADADAASDAERYVSTDDAEPTMGDHGLGDRAGITFSYCQKDQVSRRLNLGTDTWTADDLTFRVLTPAPGMALPDAEADDVDHDRMRLAVCPAVIAEITLDNTAGEEDRTLFFGFSGSDPYAALRQVREDAAGAGPHLMGIAQGRLKGIFTDADGAQPARAFSPEAAIRPLYPENAAYSLGPVGIVSAEVPAGQSRTVRFAIAFHHDGVITTGEPAAYHYTRYFDGVESVARYALSQADRYAEAADAADKRLDAATHLSDHQRWQVAQASHSYYGSTEFLDLVASPADALTPDDATDPQQVAGRTPCWVVNEGEYRMMNTFDLTVDMLFYELDHHPWTVRNTLDRFIDRYSYEDQTHFPGESELHPGGISFCHDQGVANHWTRPGHSSYEVPNLSGCFSYMTCEQLINFVCCACTYLHKTGDTAWRDRRLDTLQACLDSLVNRDHPEPDKRNGIMGLDSSRTGVGAEITTYDSLDESLGQARNNSYMAVKGWAAYLLLEKLFDDLGDTDRAGTAHDQAARAASTIAGAASDDGTIPSVLFEGHNAPIISTIEGLVFPHHAGREDALNPDGDHGRLIKALRTHIETALVEGTCLFDTDDNRGAWQLSANTENSWLSKIYLNQHVYHDILGYPRDTDAARLADQRHVQWLNHPEQAYHAWSDQCFSGVPRGSLYYPRGTTNWLWVTK